VLNVNAEHVLPDVQHKRMLIGIDENDLQRARVLFVVVDKFDEQIQHGLAFLGLLVDKCQNHVLLLVLGVVVFL